MGSRRAAIRLCLAPLLDAVLGTLGLESGVGEIAVPVLTDGLFVLGAAGLTWWLRTTTNTAWDGRVVGAAAQGAVPVSA